MALGERRTAAPRSPTFLNCWHAPKPCFGQADTDPLTAPPPANGTTGQRTADGRPAPGWVGGRCERERGPRLIDEPPRVAERVAASAPAAGRLSVDSEASGYSFAMLGLWSTGSRVSGAGSRRRMSPRFGGIPMGLSVALGAGGCGVLADGGLASCSLAPGARAVSWRLRAVGGCGRGAAVPPAGSPGCRGESHPVDRLTREVACSLHANTDQGDHPWE